MHEVCLASTYRDSTRPHLGLARYDLEDLRRPGGCEALLERGHPGSLLNNTPELAQLYERGRGFLMSSIQQTLL